MLPETEVEAPAESPPTPTPPPPAAPPLLDASLFRSPLTQGYVAGSNTTGLGIDTPLIGTPASVGVVTSDAIADQQSLSVSEIAHNVAGLTAVGDGQFGDRLFLRGFELRSRDFRRDGFLDPTFTPRDFASIQRVEVLKGPSSILYGSSSPAGTINFITKRPLNEHDADFRFQFGTFDLERYELDANAILLGEGRGLFRFNGAFEDSGSFRDFDYNDRHVIAAAATWALGERTLLTWLGDNTEARTLGDYGVPIVDGDPLALPPERYVGEPANDFLFAEDLRTSLILEHEFLNCWQVRLGVSTLAAELDTSQTRAGAPLLLPPPPGQFQRYRENLETQESTSSLVANLAGDACLLGHRHELLFGLEFAYFDSESSFSQSAFLTLFDATAPVYTNPPAILPLFFGSTIFRQARYGYYAQDLIDLNDRWQFLAGVRFDEIDQTFDRATLLGSDRLSPTFSRVSPRGAVLYQAVPDQLTAYFSYTRSFNPPGGNEFLFLDLPIQPETGAGYELGLKAKLLENLYLNTAGFYIERSNVAVGAIPTLTQVAGQRSQGFEIELLGEVTDEFRIIANYAYVDTDTSDPVTTLDGAPVRNVPHNQAAFWGRYDLIDTCEQTLGVGFGVAHVGERSANAGGDAYLPGYTRFDAGLFVRRGRLRADLYFENVGDLHYIVSSQDEHRLFPGAPFNMRAMVGMTY